MIHKEQKDEEGQKKAACMTAFFQISELYQQ